MTIVYNPFTDNLDYKGSSGGGGGVTTIAGDTGSITGANVTIFADQTNNNAGASVSFKNASTTSTFNLTDLDTQNTFLGWLAGNPAAIAAQTCTTNTAVGAGALNAVTSSSFNVAIGAGALGSLAGTVGVGANIAIGWGVASMLVDGVDNIAIGASAATGWTGSETGNILIGAVQGVAGENYVMRLGPTTGGAAIQETYIAGINGNTVSNQEFVTIDSVTGQLGTVASPSSISEYFSVYLGSPTGFVTGDGTLYGPILFDGVLLNSSTSYNTATGIYTAPSSGVYVFNCTVCFNGGTAATDNYITLFRGNTFDYRNFQLSPVGNAGGNTEIFSSTFLVPLTAGDTMSVWALASGGGLDVRLYGAAPSGGATTCLFSGYKIA